MTKQKTPKPKHHKSSTHSGLHDRNTNPPKPPIVHRGRLEKRSRVDGYADD